MIHVGVVIIVAVSAVVAYSNKGIFKGLYWVLLFTFTVCVEETPTQWNRRVWIQAAGREFTAALKADRKKVN
jgi:hypothetical protein